MSDYSQISGEHIVSLFRDHARQYGPNHVTTKDCEAELLRRLASAARPEQVTLADCVEAVERGWHKWDRDDNDRRTSRERIKDEICQLPWPHGSGVDGE